jgi:hypothetical protein
MENLEKHCLEKLNIILSKFNLNINIVNIQSNLEYRLIDNSLPKTEWRAPWLSISDILIYKPSMLSIFDRMKVYYDTFNSSGFSYIQLSDIQLSRFQRYAKVYQSIQPLKSSSLEEFLINCDLMRV